LACYGPSEEEYSMKIGILGTGRMGSTLGKLWASKSHEVFFGSRDQKKARALTA
jgi:predicted dinucleotide-binding enzyme